MDQLKNVSASSNLEELWPIYKDQHNKSYEGDEDKKRFGIFKDSVKTILDHNEKYDKGEVTYQMGINQFADLESHERKCGGGIKK